MMLQVRDSDGRIILRVLFSASFHHKFHVEDFRGNEKHSSAWKDLAETRARECLEEAGFSICVIDVGDENRFKMYCKNLFIVIQKQFDLPSEDRYMHF